MPAGKDGAATYDNTVLGSLLGVSTELDVEAEGSVPFPAQGDVNGVWYTRSGEENESGRLGRGGETIGGVTVRAYGPRAETSGDVLSCRSRKMSPMITSSDHASRTRREKDQPATRRKGHDVTRIYSQASCLLPFRHNRPGPVCHPTVETR